MKIPARRAVLAIVSAVAATLFAGGGAAASLGSGARAAPGTEPPDGPMCATPGVIVCQTPVRLTSRVFRHASSVISHVGAGGGWMPALAMMTSSLPSSTDRRIDRGESSTSPSRTSANARHALLPRCSISATVWSRSSAAVMPSSAMTSAPSSREPFAVHPTGPTRCAADQRDLVNESRHHGAFSSGEALVARVGHLGADVEVDGEPADEQHEDPWLARHVGAEIPGVGLGEQRRVRPACTLGDPVVDRVLGRLDGRRARGRRGRSMHSAIQFTWASACSTMLASTAGAPGPDTMKRFGNPSTPSPRYVRGPAAQSSRAAAASSDDVDLGQRARHRIEPGGEHDRVDVVVRVRGGDPGRVDRLDRRLAHADRASRAAR